MVSDFNSCFSCVDDPCSPISNAIRIENRKGKEYFSKINHEISEILDRLIRVSEENIGVCIREIENYAKKGMREKVVGIINKITGLINFVLNEAYDLAIQRLQHYLINNVIKYNDVLLLIFEKIINWCSNVVERIRKILEKYHTSLGIKDFSLQISLTAPFIQISFGLAINFNL